MWSKGVKDSFPVPCDDTSDFFAMMPPTSLEALRGRIAIQRLNFSVSLVVEPLMKFNLYFNKVFFLKKRSTIGL